MAPRIFSGAFLLLACAAAPLRAQQLPAFHDPSRFFEEGVELFSRQKYEAAQEKFERFVAEETLWHHQPAEDARRADAAWFRAMCAYHLLKYNAEALFLEFANRHPENAKVGYAFFYRAKLLFIKRKYDEALAELELIPVFSLSEEDEQEAQFMRGYCYFQQGRLPEAAGHLKPLTARTGPLHDRASYYYGLVEYARQNYAVALAAFRDAAAAEDYKLKVPVYISGILLHQKKYRELVEYGKTLTPTEAEFDQQAMIFQQVGTASFALKDYDAALKYLKAGKAATQAPTRELHYLLGLAYYHKGLYADAVQNLEPVAEGQDTISQGASYYLGFSYLNINRPEDARLAFRRSYSLGLLPQYNQDGLFQFGKLSFQQQFFPEAVQAFREYIDKFPQAANANEVRGLIGEALYYSNNLPEALQVFSASGLRDARTQRAYQRAALYFGLSLFEKGKLDSAELYLGRAAEMRADPGVFQTASFWYGELLYTRGRYLEAARAYNAFLASPRAQGHPNYADALIGLGWSHLIQGHRESAERSFRIAANLPGLRDNNPSAYEEANLRMGDVEFIRKNYAAAELLYNNVAQLNSRQMDYALFQSGVSGIRQERFQGGLARLKQLVASFPTSELRDTALLVLARTYFNFLNDAANAKAYSQQLLQQHPNSRLVPQAHLTLGYAARAQNDAPTARMAFRTVAVQFGSNAERAQEALDQLRALMGPDEFAQVLAEFRRAFPENNAMLEGISYQEARELFYDGKYQQALDQLNHYLRDYPGGSHLFEATALRGEAQLKLGNKEAALANFEAVYNAENAGEAKARALMGAADIRRAQGSARQAYELFGRATAEAANPADRARARMARAELALELNQPQAALEAFREVHADPNTSEFNRVLAMLGAAKALSALSQPDSALAVFQKLADENNTAQGAEAQFHVVAIRNEKKQNLETMEAIGQLRNRFRSHNLWVAKALLVAAEVYVREGKRLNAAETLKSLANNAPNAEIKARARARLAEVEALISEDNERQRQQQQQDQGPRRQGGREDTYRPSGARR